MALRHDDSTINIVVVLLLLLLLLSEQQKTLVSPSCHIIISLSTDISVHVVTAVNFA